MASTRLTLPLLAALGLSLALISGCFMFEGNVTVRVDGSADVEMRVALTEALSEFGEGGAFEEFEGELPDDWEVAPIEEDGWKGVAVMGRVEPGASLFPQGEDEDQEPMGVTVVRRLFCTDYIIEGSPGMSPMPTPPGPQAAAPKSDIVFIQQEEVEGDFDPEALMGLLGGVAQAPRVSFAIKAPGSIIETTGIVNDEGAAVWEIDLSDLEAMTDEASIPQMNIVLRTRLLNHQSIGRLADKLAAERDMPDMAALIADYVTRGLLPNPPKENPLKAGLDAEAFANAIGIIVTFEDVLGEAMTERVVRGLKLNAQNMTAKQLRETWELVADMDEEELIEVAADSVVRHVNMLAQ